MNRFCMNVLIRVVVEAETVEDAHAIVADADYEIKHDSIKNTEMIDSECRGTLDENDILTPLDEEEE